MRRLDLLGTLLVGPLFFFGCGSKEGAVCSNADAFAEFELDARAAAKSSYEPPVIEACPELDLPSDGEATSIGLTSAEYAALLRGANGNFFDDHLWWLKATPRGASHVVPLQMTAERCDSVTFAKFGYEYAFATPALPAAPTCGRYLTGLAVGHRLDDSWPEVFSVEGSGLVRAAPLSLSSSFAGFLHIPQAPRSVLGRDAKLDRLQVVRHDGDSLELAAFATGSTFASAMRLVLKVGDSTRLSVQLELEPRALAADNPLIAVAALSGWFSSDEGHDFERVRVTFADGTFGETALGDPGLNWGTGEWTSVPFAHGGSMLDSVALLHDDPVTPNLMISNLQSSDPLVFDLSLSTQSPPGGNVVANLLVDVSAAIATGRSVSLSYLLTTAP